MAGANGNGGVQTALGLAELQRKSRQTDGKMRGGHSQGASQDRMHATSKKEAGALHDAHGTDFAAAAWG